MVLMRGVGVGKHLFTTALGVLLTMSVMGCSEDSALYQQKTDFIGTHNWATGERDFGLAQPSAVHGAPRELMSVWDSSTRVGYRSDLEGGYIQAAQRHLNMPRLKTQFPSQ